MKMKYNLKIFINLYCSLLQCRTSLKPGQKYVYLFLKKNDLTFDCLKYHELTEYRQENRLTNEVFSDKVALTDDLKTRSNS